MKTWAKTKVQGLLRHQSGKYYARLYLAGKEKWLCLDTTLLEVAKAKLKNEKEALAKASKTGWVPQSGSIKVRVAIDSFEANLALRISIKESTRKFYTWSLKAIRKSWPELADMDVRHVTEKDCQTWGRKFSETYSPTYYNNAVLVLTEVFETAVKAGLIYRNPVTGLELKRKTQKALVLPTRENFHKIVELVRGGKHRTAKASAELIEFLAYTGCRISEAQRVVWGDCDFAKETILVKGDPDTGTKNWRVRTIPMIADAKLLLERMRSERASVTDADPVLLVGDVRGSLQKAAEKLKIPEICHHDLRHLFATTSIESGVDIPTVSRWLGHSDGGTLAMKTYGHLRDEHSKSAAHKVSFAASPSQKGKE